MARWYQDTAYVYMVIGCNRYDGLIFLSAEHATNLFLDGAGIPGWLTQQPVVAPV